MIAPEQPGRPTLLGRVTLSLLASALGLSIGWSWRSPHRLDPLLGLAMAVSAAIMCVEVLRVGPDRKQWVVPFTMGTMLVFLFTHPHTRLQAFAGVAAWAALSVATIYRRRRLALGFQI